MELHSRNLIIDTQYFLGVKLDFNNKNLQRLRKLVHDNSVNIFLTDITIGEVNKKIEEKIKVAFDKISISEAQYLKALPQFNKFIQDHTSSKAIEEVKKNFETFIEDFYVERISCNNLNVQDIFNMYLGKKSPFSVAKSKEFPDAFALESIKQWCEIKKQTAYLLSKDSDWKNYSEEYNRLNNNNEPTLVCLEDLSTFIDAVLRKDEELQEQITSADEKLENNISLIKREILKKFNGLEIIPDGQYEERIINFFVIDCNIIEKDIVEAKKDRATYELVVEFELVVKYQVPNYDNVLFDKEDGRMYGLEFSHIHLKQTIPEYVAIEVLFNDVENNKLKVVDVEFSGNSINIDYDDGEVFDILEHYAMLPIKIKGVENGLITDSGNGEMNFDSFQEATVIFPELKINDHSINFTSPSVSKETGHLTFQTWKSLKSFLRSNSY